jgi:hypothetical protein
VIPEDNTDPTGIGDPVTPRESVGLTAEQAFNLRLDAIVANQADQGDRLTRIHELLISVLDKVNEWREDTARELRELKRKQRELERRIEELEERADSPGG